MSATETKRLSKQFWAIDDFWNIVRVTGYECPPSTDTWWVPELGYTLSEKHHLFDTFDKTRENALAKLSSNINDMKRAYNRLLEVREPNDHPR